MNDRDQSFRGRRFRFVFAPIVLAALLVLSAVVMWLWNAILPDLVHAGRITYWKAAGLLILQDIVWRFQVWGSAQNAAFCQQGLQGKMDEHERGRTETIQGTVTAALRPA